MNIRNDIKYKCIIWDWNGTLLNDIDLCLLLINKLLTISNTNLLTYNEYREKFRFPISAFYKNIGYSFNTDDEYKDIVGKFNQEYRSNLSSCSLHKDTMYILDKFKHYKCKQYVLSGLNHDDLISSITKFGIKDYFEGVHGSRECDASDKVKVFSELNVLKEFTTNEMLFIGDTVADFDIAQKFECDCILVSHGHQNEKSLQSKTKKIVNSFKELDNIFLINEV